MNKDRAIEISKELRGDIERVCQKWVREHKSDGDIFGILNSVLATLMIGNMLEILGNETALRIAQTMIKQAYKAYTDDKIGTHYIDQDGNIREP